MRGQKIPKGRTSVGDWSRAIAGRREGSLIGLAPVFLRLDPIRVGLTALVMFGVGVLDGLTVVTLLPLFALLVSREESGAADSVVAVWTDRAFDAINITPSLGIILLVLAALALTRTLVSLGAQVYVAFVATEFTANLRMRLVQSHAAAAWPHFISLPPGAIAPAIGDQAKTAGDNFVLLARILAEVIRLTITITLAFLVSWPLALASVFVGAGVIVLLNRLVRVSRDVGMALTSSLVGITTRLVDGIAGMKTIKAMAAEKRFSEMLALEIVGLKGLERRLRIVSAATRSLQEIILLSSLVLGFYLLVDVWPVPLEELVVLAILFVRTVGSVNLLQKSFQDMAGREAAFWLVQQLSSDAENGADQVGGTRNPGLDRCIEFDKVTLMYGSSLVLREVSFSIPAQGMTVIVGPSGTGKTTLIDLIMGLISPQDGAILVDGASLSDCDLVHWRRQIGYVPQETYLFHGTVATNVSMGDPSISRSEVVKALKAAEIWPEIESLESGIDSDVGERGARFSVGQRQRISLARALVRQPQLIILDEATASLDGQTAESVCRTLKRLARNYPIIAVTHHQFLEQYADRVLEVVDGSVSTRNLHHQEVHASGIVRQ